MSTLTNGLIEQTFDTAPSVLRAYDQWVLWRLEPSPKGKATKIPYQPNGRKANATDPSTWSSYDEVVAASASYSGIGFVLTESDPFVAIDLDNCVNAEGTTTEWADDVIAEIGSYTEWSPSGNGVHILASAPGFRVDGNGNRAGTIEIYSDARYMTFTGRTLYPGEKLEAVEERLGQVSEWHARVFAHRASNVVPIVRPTLPSREDLAVVASAAEDPSWAKLHAGDDSDFNDDASQGDLVFCKILARQTSDDDQIDRIYRRSGRYRAKWDSKRGGSTYGAGTINKARLTILQDGTPGENTAPVGVDGYGYHDQGNAQRLIHSHPGTLRWVEEWDEWVVFEGTRWVRDLHDTRVRHLAAQLADPLLEQLGALRTDDKAMKALMAWYRTTKTAPGVANCVKMAKDRPEVLTCFKALDSHPWLLNTPNKTIDLETGYSRDHDPADMLMKQTAVPFDDKAKCPQWEAFLERIMPDADVRGYLQRLAGLTLVGIPQQILAILWGDGANGKSTLTEVLASVLGDYAVPVSQDLLVMQKNQQHPTSKADLFGARFAHSGEISESDVLNEALVKALTGGDLIKARRMGENFWHFEPSHLLWLHANYKPRISGTDTGIWRRVKLIPFLEIIPPAERVEGLARKLFKTEGSGVLNWMLRGLGDYLRNGMDEPDAVRAATDEYRQDTDTVSTFLDDVGIVFEEGASMRAMELDMAHAQWYGSSAVRLLEPTHLKMVKKRLKDRDCVSQIKQMDGWRGTVWVGCHIAPMSLDLNQGEDQ